RAWASVHSSDVRAPARILDRGDHAQRLPPPLGLPVTVRLGRDRRLPVRPRGPLLARRRRGPPHDDRLAGPRRGHLRPDRQRSVTYAMFNISAASAGRVARYHYAGSLPVAIVLCLILQQVGRLPAFRAIPAPLALVTGLGAIAYGAVLHPLAIQLYEASPEYL